MANRHPHLFHTNKISCYFLRFAAAICKRHTTWYWLFCWKKSNRIRFPPNQDNCPQTALIHAPRQAPQYIETIQPPLFRASTIIFKTTTHLFDRHWTDAYDYSYGTHGTPTTFTLADNIAQIEGGDFCLLAPSGLSAINLVNSAFLSSGDEVWVADNIYGPNLEHLKNLQDRYDIRVRIYNPIDAASFQPTEKTKLIWLEAAGSVTLEFPDLKNLVKKAQQANVLTALDNTWGAGLAFNAFATTLAFSSDTIVSTRHSSSCSSSSNSPKNGFAPLTGLNCPIPFTCQAQCS